MPFRVLVLPGGTQNINLANELAPLINISSLSQDFEIRIFNQFPINELNLTNFFALESTQFDALHFIGHCDGDGVYISETERLRDEQIFKLCKAGRVKLIFLNTCSSARIGQYLVNRGLSISLAYITKVLDQDAIVTAVRFYSELARGLATESLDLHLRKAYELAAPDDGSMLWLTNGSYTQSIISPLVSRMDVFDTHRNTKFAEFEQLLQELLRQQQDGNTFFLNKVAKFETWIRQELNAFRAASKRNFTILRAFLVIITILIVLFVASQVWAQTVPEPTPIPTGVENPTATLLPGCGSSGSQPDKCNTETPTQEVPTPVESTSTPVPPTALPSTDTPVPKPTKEDTPTRFPTWTKTPTPEDTATSTSTGVVTVTATLRPKNTSTPKPTATNTMSAFEQAVHDAVQATLIAINCPEWIKTDE